MWCISTYWNLLFSSVKICSLKIILSHLKFLMYFNPQYFSHIAYKLRTYLLLFHLMKQSLCLFVSFSWFSCLFQEKQRCNYQYFFLLDPLLVIVLIALIWISQMQWNDSGDKNNTFYVSLCSIFFNLSF